MADTVSIMRCEEYDYLKVKNCLLENIRHLGGLPKHIGKGEKVLLKVNLLMKKTPEEATTTHPVFVRALSDILLEYGASVVIGDSPGGPFTEGSLRGIYKASGMEAIAAETAARLNSNYNTFEKDNPQGIMLKKLVVTDMLNDVDKVISVSKLKTHGMMTLTGAAKNMFGVIPGLIKAQYHMNMPAHTTFADALIDICLCASPVLSFMDGIVGMEGEGPSSGTPRKIGAVIASNSPFQLDKVAASIIHLDFAKVPTIYRSITRGLAGETLEDIELRGEDWHNFFIDDFVIPKTKLVFPNDSMPGFVKNFMNRHVQPRPVFNHDTCIGCADCAKNCPAKVIRMKDKKPEADLKNCIRCFCCQELCPKKAVTIYRPAILKLLNK